LLSTAPGPSLPAKRAIRFADRLRQYRGEESRERRISLRRSAGFLEVGTFYIALILTSLLVELGTSLPNSRVRAHRADQRAGAS
jgi:hypothetical protein